MGLGATGQLDDNDVLLQQSSANWKTFKANWKTFKGQDLDDKGNKKGLLKSWGESWQDYHKKNVLPLIDEKSATEASRRRIKREAEVNNIPYKSSLAYHKYFAFAIKKLDEKASVYGRV